MIKIERYKNTRHWAVWLRGELVAVVCYKKGAKAIARILNQKRNPSKPAGLRRPAARRTPRRFK